MIISQNPGDLISSEFLDERNVVEVQVELDNLFGEYAPIAEFDISIHKIEYYTIDPFGNLTVASGAISFPVNVNFAFPSVSIQHGTVLERENVPSQYGFDGYSLCLSSTGFVTILPDYLGLGESELLHPYHHQESTANSVIDMIRASRYFCSNFEDIQTNHQLFLAGYSEGGYATMVTHKVIEESYFNELHISASFPMAGAYDLSGVMTDLMLSAQPYPEPFYLPYILLTMIEYNQLGDLQDFFVEEYANLLPILFDGYHSSEYVNNQLPNIPIDMLLPEAVDQFENNPEYSLIIALQSNNVWEWIPQLPMYLFHGVADELVPVENSLIAFEYFIQNGAEDVVLETLPEEYGGHNEAAIPSLFGAFYQMNLLSMINQKGDVIADMSINILDLTKTIEIILSGIFSNYELWSADINEDGYINIADVLLIKNLMFSE